MDNNMIVWNPLKNTKLNVVPVTQPYTMSCRFGFDNETIVYGGLDCNVYCLE